VWDVFGGRISSFVRDLVMRLYRVVCKAVVCCLVLFMAWKSRQPLQEMFGPAPWINSYDQYFLMNSQGVFGFINSHRVQPVLLFSHDPAAHAKLQDESVWQTLDFACLPGRPERFPCIMSPYHSRLDWETWIRTTASMEHLFTQGAGPNDYFQQTPHFLGEVMGRLLAGDGDTADLFATPREVLFRNGTAPKFMRLRYFSYTFTKPGSDVWWDRKPLDGGIGVIWPEDHAARPDKTALFLSCILATWNLDGLFSHWKLQSLPSLALSLSAFAAWLVEDYSGSALVQYEIPWLLAQAASFAKALVGSAASALLSSGLIRSDRGLAAGLLLCTMFPKKCRWAALLALMAFSIWPR